MKTFVYNFILFMLAVGSGIGLFLMKYRVVEYEKELAAIHRTIINDRREIHALKADWAVLTEPSRLRKLIEERTDFKTIQGKQIVHAEDLDFVPVPVPPVKPNFEPDEVVPETEADHVVP